MSKPSVKSLCLIRHRQRLLLAEGQDPISQQTYLRPIGGSLNFGESAEQAAKREVLEEIGVEVCTLSLLGIIENHFSFNHQPGHEIVFIYQAELVDTSLYQQSVWQGQESDGHGFIARWFDLQQLASQQMPVYPAGCLNLMDQNPSQNELVKNRVHRLQDAKQR